MSYIRDRRNHIESHFWTIWKSKGSGEARSLRWRHFHSYLINHWRPDITKEILCKLLSKVLWKLLSRPPTIPLWIEYESTSERLNIIWIWIWIPRYHTYSLPNISNSYHPCHCHFSTFLLSIGRYIWYSYSIHFSLTLKYFHIYFILWYFLLIIFVLLSLITFTLWSILVYLLISFIFISVF